MRECILELLCEYRICYIHVCSVADQHNSCRQELSSSRNKHHTQPLLNHAYLTTWVYYNIVKNAKLEHRVQSVHYMYILRTFIHAASAACIVLMTACI